MKIPGKSLKVGFIGLGNIGMPMAAGLVKKGFRVKVFDIRKAAIDELVEKGAIGAGSPREVCEGSDAVVLMVKDSSQIDAMLQGENGLWRGLGKGSTLIISSTVDPSYSKMISEEAKKKGVHVLDAAASGAKVAAEAGTLTFMVGGDKDAFDTCLPIFEAMGSKVFHMGGVGSGDAMKLVNNMIGIINIAGSSEAIAVGLKAGIDLEQMLAVIKTSTGANWAIDHWDFLSDLMKNSPPGTRNFQKDMGLGVKFANSVGEKAPISALVSQLDDSQYAPKKAR